ncbi:MAG: preprotein translocase subunit Sec61beta [archaeon]
MKMNYSKSSSQSPSSSIGIMKFKDNVNGIKFSPEVIIGVTIGLILLIIILRIVFNVS